LPVLPFEKELKMIGKRGCKYCSHQALCEDDDCEMCFQSSFASSDKAVFWESYLTSSMVGE